MEKSVESNWDFQLNRFLVVLPAYRQAGVGMTIWYNYRISQGGKNVNRDFVLRPKLMIRPVSLNLLKNQKTEINKKISQIG
jgi:hypothetical protein